MGVVLWSSVVKASAATFLKTFLKTLLKTLLKTFLVGGTLHGSCRGQGLVDWIAKVLTPILIVVQHQHVVPSTHQPMLPPCGGAHGTSAARGADGMSSMNVQGARRGAAAAMLRHAVMDVVVIMDVVVVVRRLLFR